MAETFPLPPREAIASQVDTALAEDVGSGDLTAALLDEQLVSKAVVIAREDGILCGTAWFDEVFRQVDAETAIHWLRQDGDPISADSRLCEIRGSARSLLTAERAALNFLQTLSGTATVVKRYVEEVEGTGVRILDTRKTIPGLRLAQKYAVLCGGGANHRIGLYDAVLIKENHVSAAGGIASAVSRARQSVPHTQKIEVEVRDQAEVAEALDAGADILLLDNMSTEELRSAVEMINGRAITEASGGVNLETIREIAETGVQLISVGALTHSYHAVDISMLFN